jgi:hypothetical protein
VVEGGAGVCGESVVGVRVRWVCESVVGVRVWLV